MSSRTPDRDTDSGDAVGRLLDWYAVHARDLPWRAADRTPWGVLVSEIMLQQTQVSRVEPRWREWLQRWPAPVDLARAPLAEVLVAWQGMGYPRRALRLHAAAGAIVAQHGGAVPASVSQLRALPGIGEYTAAAVVAFAFGEPVAVLDTNVRRVFARWWAGTAFPSSSSITNAEREVAESLLPGGGLAPLWSVAVMELGALVCGARRTECGICPLRADCAWLAAGQPAGKAPARQAAFDGSDRQARGFLMRRVTQHGDADRHALTAAWHTYRGGAAGASAQAQRALDSLLDDGLLQCDDGRIGLPLDPH